MKKNLRLSIGLLSAASALQSQGQDFRGDQNLDKTHKVNPDLTGSEVLSEDSSPGIDFSEK
jgi:hypothetical protein